MMRLLTRNLSMGQDVPETSHKILKISALLAGALALYFTSSIHYLLYHFIVELFGVAIAWGVFALTWNSRAMMRNNYLLLLGISYLFIGILSLLQTLALSGMNVFQGHGDNLSAQLWMATRYLESISYFAAACLLGRALNPRLALGTYLGVFSLILLSIFVWGIFPTCFVQGQGLTSFKYVSEFVVSGIFLGALALLYRKRQEFDPLVWRLVGSSLLAMVISDLAFTFSVGFYDVSNLLGDYFRVIAFYLMYKAIIETGLTKPFSLMLRDLKQAEAALRRANEDLEKQVQERTAALQEANAQLRQEIEERLSAEASLRKAQENLRHLTSQILQIQERERGRISRELHDDLGQSLIVLKLILSKVVRTLDKSEGASEELQAGLQQLNGLIEKVRRICRNLSPPILEDLGLEAALQALINEFSDGQDLHFAVNLEKVSPLLSQDVQVAVYRIFQEVLTNISKHAGASEVTIAIGRENDRVRFLIADNGRGFDLKAVKDFTNGRRGVGLASIEERVSMLGGVSEIHSQADSGTRVSFSLPIEFEPTELKPGTIHAW